MATVVVGLGKTGLSCVKYLVNQGVDVIVVDTRKEPPLLDELSKVAPNTRVMTGELSPGVISQADRLVVSPGVSLETPVIADARANGVACIGDIELFVSAAQAPVIAITGSNGKTTLTTLVGKMLCDANYRVEVCGNIGEPVLDVLAKEVPDYYVVELSSFQLETTHSLQAHIAIVLNISADHMDRYPSLAEYRVAKQRIYSNCEMALLNADEPEIWYELNLPDQRCTFGYKDADFCLVKDKGDQFISHKGRKWFSVAELPWQGWHHYQNTLAALAIGVALGLQQQQMLKTLQAFVELPHRCQKIASFAGVDWYNDSKGTNVGATIAALNSVGPLYSDIILIAGGDAKGADLSGIKPAVCEFASQVILLGKDADKLAALLADDVACTQVKNLEAAVTYAHKMAAESSAVLLSPACASWDMFDNYQQRGEVFVEAVMVLRESRFL